MKIKRMVTIAAGAIVFLLSGVALAKDGDMTTTGSIQALSASEVQVSGVGYTLTSATEYENRAGQHVALAAFQVGDLVKLHWRLDSGARVVREMEQRSSGGISPTPSPTGTPHQSREHEDSDHGNRRGSSDDRSAELKRSLPKLIVTNARAKVEYRREKRERRLKMVVKLPTGTIPAVTQLADAKNLDFEATIARSGVAIATCSLDLDTTPEEAYFEFQLDGRVKKGRTRYSKGTCDSDLAVEGIQAEVPTLQKGDSVVIREVTTGDMFSGSIR